MWILLISSKILLWSISHTCSSYLSVTVMVMIWTQFLRCPIKFATTCSTYERVLWWIKRNFSPIVLVTIWKMLLKYYFILKNSFGKIKSVLPPIMLPPQTIMHLYSQSGKHLLSVTSICLKSPWSYATTWFISSKINNSVERNK